MVMDGGVLQFYGNICVIYVYRESIGCPLQEKLIANFGN
jgi:hypothetical protein